MVALNFNAQQYEPRYAGGGGIPAGKGYRGIICDAEQRPTSKGDGGMLALTLKVIDGPMAGATMEDRLNLWNKSSQAVDIANKQLSAYCHVLGVYVVADTTQLMNIPFMFDVGPQASNPNYTEITDLYDINGNKPGKAGGGAAPQGQQAPPAQPPAQPPAAGGWGNQGTQLSAQPGGWGSQGGAQPQAQPQQGGWTPPGQGQAPAQPPAAGGWGSAQPPQQPPQQPAQAWTPPAAGAGGAPPWGAR